MSTTDSRNWLSLAGTLPVVAAVLISCGTGDDQAEAPAAPSGTVLLNPQIRNTFEANVSAKILSDGQVLLTTSQIQEMFNGKKVTWQPSGPIEIFTRQGLWFHVQSGVVNAQIAGRWRSFKNSICVLDMKKVEYCRNIIIDKSGGLSLREISNIRNVIDINVNENARVVKVDDYHPSSAVSEYLNVH